MRWAGDNPPQGALITYYLKNQPAGEVNITVTDAAGKVVRRMRRVSDDAGVNRVPWDLRYDAPVGGGGGFGGGGGGRGAGAAGQEADTSLEAVRPAVARRPHSTRKPAGVTNSLDLPAVRAFYRESTRLR
jgi:Flagellar hook capping protein